MRNFIDVCDNDDGRRRNRAAKHDRQPVLIQHLKAELVDAGVLSKKQKSRFQSSQLKGFNRDDEDSDSDSD